MKPQRIVTRQIIYSGNEDWVAGVLEKSFRDATDAEPSFSTMFGTIRIKTLSDRTVDPDDLPARDTAIGPR